ncbi:MAG: hypothetical protein AAB223_11475 [Pseudomonadota bacterium]
MFDELLKFAERFQSLGVAGVMAFLGYFIIRYLVADIDRWRHSHASAVAELRAAQEARLADQVKWAEAYRQASVKDETTAQALTKAMTDQAAAFVKLADKIA